ncbi:D-aspartate oxidase isoform X3 [Limanda limanda]|uniref:D-aspartate oxidase isoform X3 n=1 Tax=Limanda limanda TaxID=27771 RepID=UPI0029C90234|nr:D-aspartate oxidase isoform X3 [Limanda limanda]
MTSVRVVVVGAGVIGFSTAVCIAEALPSCSVTLLSEKFSPDTTSDGAAGIMFAGEFPDIPLERQRLWFKDSFDHLLAIAQSQHAPEAGVMLSSGFKRAGGQVHQRKVDNLQELSNSYDIIVNCSGLGSKLLVGDSQVYPVRGQVLKVEAPWLQHFIRDGDGKTYIYPGIHGATIGGTRQEGDWRLEVDEGDTKSILERCSRLEPSISKAKVLSEWVGLRPSRRNLRLEREVVQLQGRQVPVVHNYGHGGWGVTLAWGTALDAMSLVRQCLREKPAQAKL